MEFTLKIEGMMCPHCSGRVKKVLEALDACETAEVSHETGLAVVTLCGAASDDLLRKAYEICREKTGKFQAGYITRVLENWRAQDADTLEKIEELENGKPKAEPSEENNAYETMVEQYVPVYKKKKG